MFTVLWDNDGVLVDTEGLYFEACRDVLASVGVVLTPEQFQDISLRRGESTLLLAADHGCDAVMFQRLRRQRNEQYGRLLMQRCPVIPGAGAVLQSLHGQVHMGVVTSSRRDHFAAAHSHSGLLPYLDFVLTREDYLQTKPHPEPYLTAIQRYALDPARCIVVEDSVRGLASALAAGLNCIMVRSRWTRDADFAGATAVVESLTDVPQEIRRQAKW